jgi:hypothetical protein
LNETRESFAESGVQVALDSVGKHGMRPQQLERFRYRSEGAKFGEGISAAGFKRNRHVPRSQIDQTLRVLIAGRDHDYLATRFS